MGMRVRLKASFDLSGYPPQARVILQAMKTYGMMVADNGSDWFFQGASDPRWDDDDLNTIKECDRQQLRSGEDGAADDQLVDQASGRNRSAQIRYQPQLDCDARTRHMAFSASPSQATTCLPLATTESRLRRVPIEA